MAKKYILLEEYEWLGEFWFINDKEHKFPGLLKYTPKDGIRLKALLTDISNKEVGMFLNGKFDKDVVHGYAFNTGEITLLSVSSIGAGYSNFRDIEEEFRCEAAIFNCHIDNINILFDACDFAINNMNDFVSRKALNLNEQYLIDNELSATHNDVSIEIKKNALSVFGPSKLSSFIIDDNTELRSDIDKAISPVIKKHSRLSIYLIKEINYYIHLKGKENQSISFKELLEKIRQISSLFSLLFLKIVEPLEITLKSELNDRGHYDKKYPVLLSKYLEDKQIRKISRDKDYMTLPVTIVGIKDDFNGIINKWIDFLKEDRNIIQETLFNHIYFRVDAMQHYLLLLAAIERLHILEESEDVKKLKKSKYIERYDWFITKYAPEDIIILFRKYLPDTRKKVELGALLGEIRNFIIHPASNKYWKDKVDYVLISNLSELIVFVFTIVLYKRIGISAEAVDKFIKNHNWHIDTWEQK